MGFKVWMPVWMLMMGMKNLKEVKPNEWAYVEEEN